MAELEGYAGSKVGKRRLQAIRARYPVNEDHPRFDPWSDDQKRDLEALYAADLAALDERVRVWRPGDGFI